MRRIAWGLAVLASWAILLLWAARIDLSSPFAAAEQREFPGDDFSAVFGVGSDGDDSGRGYGWSWSVCRDGLHGFGVDDGDGDGRGVRAGVGNGPACGGARRAAQAVQQEDGGDRADENGGGQPDGPAWATAGWPGSSSPCVGGVVCDQDGLDQHVAQEQQPQRPGGEREQVEDLLVIQGRS